MTDVSNLTDVWIAVKHLQQATETAGGKYVIEQILADAQAMFDRYAPWQEGDRTSLMQAPGITTGGWRGSKHFLVTGHAGVVHSVRFHNGLFVADWEPDDQTYKHYATNELMPVTRPSYYSISEKLLKPTRANGVLL